MFKSLRHKIALALVLSSLIALLTGVLFSIRIYEDRVREQSAQELHEAAASLSQNLESISGHLENMTKPLAANPAIISGTRKADAAGLTHDLLPFLHETDLNYAEITDSSGSVVLSMADSLDYGYQSANPLVRPALLQAASGHGLLTNHDEIFLVATCPIKAAGVPVGVLTIGILIDSELLDHLTNEHDEHYTIWVNPRQPSVAPVCLKPLPPVEEILIQEEVSRLYAGEMLSKTLKVGGDSYQATYFTQSGLNSDRPLVCASYRSMSYLAEAARDTRLHLAVIILIILTLAGGYSWWLSRRVTRPLARLLGTVKNMANLNFNANIDIPGQDEIHELADSFNHLSQELQKNIMQRDRYAADLAQLNQNLERQVAGRTEELMHINLRLQREMSEKEDFLRAVSHDLGAPLRNVAGLTRLVDRRYKNLLGDEGREMLTRISSNVKNELQMIEQLLELSRIKTRRSRAVEIDLNELLGEIRADLSYTIQERKIHLATSDILPIIYGEKNRIRQIFQNLIDNALKYMGEQPDPHIDIGWAEHRDCLMFWVADNGIGIPPDQRGKIFGVFRRIRRSEVMSVEGKGVGLATVKSIVEMYGGEIWVESELTQGSTFYFTLSKSLVGQPTGTPDNTEILEISQDQFAVPV